MDATFERLIHDPRVIVHLISMPRTGNERGNDHHDEETDVDPKKKRLKTKPPVKTQQKPLSSQISSSQISRVGSLFHAFYVLNNAFKRVIMHLNE